LDLCLLGRRDAAVKLQPLPAGPLKADRRDFLDRDRPALGTSDELFSKKRAFDSMEQKLKFLATVSLCRDALVNRHRREAASVK
jgi:hypothetical protein